MTTTSTESFQTNTSWGMGQPPLQRIPVSRIIVPYVAPLVFRKTSRFRFPALSATHAISHQGCQTPGILSEQPSIMIALVVTPATSEAFSHAHSSTQSTPLWFRIACNRVTGPVHHRRPQALQMAIVGQTRLSVLDEYSLDAVTDMICRPRNVSRRGKWDRLKP